VRRRTNVSGKSRSRNAKHHGLKLLTADPPEILLRANCDKTPIPNARQERFPARFRRPPLNPRPSTLRSSRSSTTVPDNYYLDTHTLGKNKKPIFFGGVRMGKGYVSYYLMPAYSPELQKGMSPALKKRMQGKACFNFTVVDEELFAELRKVTKQAYAEWKKTGWVD
jgi:hypothetical protein